MTESEMRELDAWIAGNVMGCKRTENPDEFTDSDASLFWHRKQRSEKVPKQNPVVVVSHPYFHKSISMWAHQWNTFAPTTSPADALAVLEKCGEQAFVEIYREPNGPWKVRRSSLPGCRAKAETLPLAICKFARKLYES